MGAVEHALIACQARSTNNAGHSHRGNYSEPIAALAIIQTSSAAPLKGAKVVTWGRFKDRNNGNNAWVTGVMNPCGGGFELDDTDVWGCARFTGPEGLDMIVIPAGTQSTNTPIDYNPTISYPCFS